MANKKEKKASTEQPDQHLVDVMLMIIELRDRLDKLSLNSGKRVERYKLSNEEALNLVK